MSTVPSSHPPMLIVAGDVIVCGNHLFSGVAVFQVPALTRAGFRAKRGARGCEVVRRT